ncbi:MAG: undecaprenyldiphospho-muramoylpentapeptide beta-N-acetylglucosaminyltransferase [Clostridiales bacterium]|nr:undecaprenyldiphospho-muramoylpentapeptide beta-N-acetylglucosaminyltransferase [Clostridiales bacterium]
MKKIILTGGGTAGHVTPCIALIPKLIEEGFEIEYIGSFGGIERKMIEDLNIKYYPVSTGKFRRYLSAANIADGFKVIKGVADSFFALKKAKPDIIFSKGGFVGVPVVIAGKMLGIKSVIHESDASVGLANKISIPFASKVCLSFPETLKYVSEAKAVLTGTPIRKTLFSGNRREGLELCGFDGSKSVMLVMGGSLGSAKINAAVKEALPKLTKCFHVAHICGRGNIDENIKNENYRQFEFVTGELAHLFAAADIVVSRAGANAISEIAALKKPCLLIPLSKAASRGDQILNAESFEKRGFAKILYEEDLTDSTLLTEAINVNANSREYIAKLRGNSLSDGVDEVMRVIKGCAG